MHLALETGGLFRLAIKLMQNEAADDRNFTELSNLLGIYFQIRDDYINLQSEKVFRLFHHTVHGCQELL